MKAHNHIIKQFYQYHLNLFTINVSKGKTQVITVIELYWFKNPKLWFSKSYKKNQVTTVGGTYSGLGTVESDYTYRQLKHLVIIL